MLCVFNLCKKPVPMIGQFESHHVILVFSLEAAESLHILVLVLFYPRLEH